MSLVVIKGQAQTTTMIYMRQLQAVQNTYVMGAERIYHTSLLLTLGKDLTLCLAQLGQPVCHKTALGRRKLLNRQMIFLWVQPV